MNVRRDFLERTAMSSVLALENQGNRSATAMGPALWTRRHTRQNVCAKRVSLELLVKNLVQVVPMEMCAMAMGSAARGSQAKHSVNALAASLAMHVSTTALETQNLKGRKRAMDTEHAQWLMANPSAAVRLASWVRAVLLRAPSIRG